MWGVLRLVVSTEEASAHPSARLSSLLPDTSLAGSLAPLCSPIKNAASCPCCREAPLALFRALKNTPLFVSPSGALTAFS